MLAKASGEQLLEEKSTAELFYCEYIQTALDYYRYEDSIEYLKKLESLHGSIYSLSGAMGRRTKHQSFSVPQSRYEM